MKKKKKIKTIEDVMQLDVEQIEIIYQGVDRQCRCGCAGSYYTDYPMMTKLLAKAKKYINEGVKYGLYERCINIPTHDKSLRGKCITIYFKK
jgi:hypothetical protein